MPRTDVLTPVRDGDVLRLRLCRTVDKKGTTNREVITDTFLDGTQLVQSLCDGVVMTEVRSTGAPVPARTNDITDWGRLNTAILALIRQAQQYGPDNPCPPEQMAVMIANFRQIEAWMAKARENTIKAEGSVALAESAMRSLLNMP